MLVAVSFHGLRDLRIGCVERQSLGAEPPDEMTFITIMKD